MVLSWHQFNQGVLMIKSLKWIIGLFVLIFNPLTYGMWDIPGVSSALEVDDVRLTRNGAFVKLDNDHVIYAKYSPPAKGMPTIVLMNGLPDTLHEWRGKDRRLAEKGYGVLTFDFRGQGHTLVYQNLKLGNLHWTEQVDDIRGLLKFFKIKKAIVSGLSYGGGIAIAFATTHPKLVSKVIAFAPFVEPVEPTDSAIRRLTSMTLEWFPQLNYQQVFTHWFRQIVYFTYPLLEPSILAHPMKPEATTQLAIGIRDFNAHKAVANLPNHALTLVGGTMDQSVTLDILDRLWEATPEEKRHAFITLNSGHRITTSRPQTAADIVEAVLTTNRLQHNSHLHWTIVDHPAQCNQILTK